MSPDFDVMFAPARTYARASAHPAPDAWWTLVRRPALVGVVLGLTCAIAATDHVDLRIALSLIAWWAVVPVIQLAVAALAIDLFFMSQAPWSLWLLAYAGWEMLTPVWLRPANIVVWCAAVPIVWTTVILRAFFRVVIGASARGAWTRVVLHQTATWALFLAYYGTSIAIWPRLLGFWQQWRG
jgi:hypothetical protein